MPSSVLIELEIPTDLEQFRLPAGVQQRLQDLLDRQDHMISVMRGRKGKNDDKKARL